MNKPTGPVIAGPDDIRSWPPADFLQATPTRTQLSYWLSRGWGDPYDVAHTIGVDVADVEWFVSGACFYSEVAEGAPVRTPDLALPPKAAKARDLFLRLLNAIQSGAVPASKAGEPVYDLPTAETADLSKCAAVLSEVQSTGNKVGTQAMGTPDQRLRRLALDGVNLSVADVAAICDCDVATATRFLTLDVRELPWNAGNTAFETFRKLMHVGSVGMTTQVTPVRRGPVVTSGDVY